MEDAANYITTLIQTTFWMCTPIKKKKASTGNIPLEIKEKVLEKRRLRRVWHQSWHKSDKTALNKAIKELKEMLDDITMKRYKINCRI